MPEPSYARAPQWRILLAGRVDVAIAGALGRAIQARVGRRALRPVATLRSPMEELVREQIGSPGQLLLGVRTVDRRTGSRLALRRSLVVFASASGRSLLRGRLLPGGSEHRRAVRVLAPIAAGVASRRLRRRVAPTVQVLAGGRPDHNP